MKSCLKKGSKDLTKPKKRVYFEHKEFTKEDGLDDAPPTREYSILGKESSMPELESESESELELESEPKPKPELPKFNYIQNSYQGSPVRDRSIYQKKAPKKGKRFNLFKMCLS